MGVWLNRFLNLVPTRRRGWTQVVVESMQGRRDGPSRCSFHERSTTLRAGFTPETAFIYQISSNEPGNYVTERARHMTGSIVNGEEGKRLLDDKNEFTERMPDHLRPDIVGHVVAGRFRSANDESLASLLRRHEKLVVKPVRGRRGNGVSVIDDPGHLPERGEFIVTEFVRQAAYASEIFEQTTNTIRVLTLRDEGGPFVAAACHRFGSKESVPVDNWSLGGVCAGVDLLTGELGQAVRRPGKAGFDWRDCHPETDARIAGVRIPGWDAVLEVVEAVGERFPFLLHVGWDVVITGDGHPQFLEGNNYSDLELIQVHGGLLADERVRRAYARLGMV